MTVIVKLYPEEVNNDILCENFNNFFSNKVCQIVTEINNMIASESLVPNYNYHSATNNSDSITQFGDFASVTEDEVSEIIKSSKIKTSKLDPLPTELFKCCLDLLIKPMKIIINKSLSSGTFPDALKNAVIKPILKPDKKDHIYCNYRPVSNVPFISKIIEKAVLKQLIPHLNSTNNFANNNSAYKPGYSTETILLKIHSDIINNIDQQKN